MTTQHCWRLDCAEQKCWQALHSQLGKKTLHPFTSFFSKSIQSHFDVFTHRWSRCGEWGDFSVTAEQSWAAEEVKKLHEGAEVRGNKWTPSFEKEEKLGFELSVYSRAAGDEQIATRNVCCDELTLKKIIKKIYTMKDVLSTLMRAVCLATALQYKRAVAHKPDETITQCGWNSIVQALNIGCHVITIHEMNVKTVTVWKDI